MNTFQVRFPWRPKVPDQRGGEGVEPADAAAGDPRVARPIPRGLPGAAQLPLPVAARGVLPESHAGIRARPKGKTENCEKFPFVIKDWKITI